MVYYKHKFPCYPVMAVAPAIGALYELQVAGYLMPPRM